MGSEDRAWKPAKDAYPFFENPASCTNHWGPFYMQVEVHNERINLSGYLVVWQCRQPLWHFFDMKLFVKKYHGFLNLKIQTFPPYLSSPLWNLNSDCQVLGVILWRFRANPRSTWVCSLLCFIDTDSALHASQLCGKFSHKDHLATAINLI